MTVSNLFCPKVFLLPRRLARQYRLLRPNPFALTLCEGECVLLAGWLRSLAKSLHKIAETPQKVAVSSSNLWCRLHFDCCEESG
jgi:hypothetical protein